MNQAQLGQALDCLDCQEALALWKQLELLQKQKLAPVTIVNAGLVKAGKSTFFNALIDREHEFAVGAVRKTVQNQAFAAEHHTLIDTPGLGADADDTRIALDAYKQADLLLFFHNVNDGELSKTEVAGLRDALAAFPEESTFWSRVLFVCTNASSKEKEEAAYIGQIIVQQLRKEFGVIDPQIYLTDAHLYFTGRHKGIESFIRDSGVPEVRTRILEELVSLVETRSRLLRSRKQFIVRNIQDAIEAQRGSELRRKQAELAEQKESAAQKVSSLEACVRKISEKKEQFLKQQEQAKMTCYQDYEESSPWYEANHGNFFYDRCQELTRLFTEINMLVAEACKSNDSMQRFPKIQAPLSVEVDELDLAAMSSLQSTFLGNFGSYNSFRNEFGKNIFEKAYQNYASQLQSICESECYAICEKLKTFEQLEKKEAKRIHEASVKLDEEIAQLTRLNEELERLLEEKGQLNEC
ncbi:hypothetical protein EDM59_20505 [Brevibacillus nitrificans]|uniref:G domain-containing protein n=1 Tax=Brevibacillus nitrificans TaxID=651560 RepID=A0A3M8D5P2_9BACL|nr:GTPase [Brevibacillus nitrificans]RNB82535.1 hypothetical protein EDM59_20505 [Brevibacillus nitrificans]